jgi:predicted transposase/invertase (TIGR01784 family)
MADRQDADSPWKNILRAYFPEAIQFFFPHIAKLIDWQVPPVFLDKEFQQLSPNAEVGKRYADQLVQVKLKRGKSLILLLHLEIQANKEQKFEERMLTYAFRIYDFFHQPACSLAILCDSNPTWRPKEHILATPGSKLTFEFTAIKLLDYRNQWAELENSINPFATVVMAHLTAQETKTKAQERKTWKFQLVRGLYEKGYNRSQVMDLFKFIDWIIVLPERLNNSFWNELKIYEEERKMAYVTSVEKIGFKRGQQEAQKEAQERIEKIVLKMIEEQVPLETIAKVTELSIAQIQQIQVQQA